MIDQEEGGKFQIYTQFSLSENESPFRVVIDPPIGNINQLIGMKLNFIIGKYFKLLRDLTYTMDNRHAGLGAH